MIILSNDSQVLQASFRNANRVTIQLDVESLDPKNLLERFQIDCSFTFGWIISTLYDVDNFILLIFSLKMD